jgi:hypothetical protein
VIPLNTLNPWDGTRLLDVNDEHLDEYPGLAEWWRKSVDVWIKPDVSRRSADLSVAKVDVEGPFARSSTQGVLIARFGEPAQRGRCRADKPYPVPSLEIAHRSPRRTFRVADG